jgi:hypothetical protein
LSFLVIITFLCESRVVVALTPCCPSSTEQKDGAVWESFHILWFRLRHQCVLFRFSPLGFEPGMTAFGRRFRSKPKHAVKPGVLYDMESVAAVLDSYRNGLPIAHG